MKTFSIASFILITFYANSFFAQGCSDAGFCSIDGIKQNNVEQNLINTATIEPFSNNIKTGISIGNTRYNVWIFNSYLAYSRQINKQLSFSIKMDGQYRFGELNQVFGFSDLSLSMSQKLSKSFGIIAGGKIPFNDANNKYKGNSMPMAYQTSLGSYDAILGVQYVQEKIFVVIGWQQPFIQNSNTFMIGNFSKEELGAKYPNTNKFKRAGDLLLRISYRHIPKVRMKNFSFTYSLLPIYHLKNDEYTNAEKKIVEIKDSKGLTLNTNVFVNYRINNKSAIEISTGFPLIARKLRPEGLSQFAITIEFIKRF